MDTRGNVFSCGKCLPDAYGKWKLVRLDGTAGLLTFSGSAVPDESYVDAHIRATQAGAIIPFSAPAVVPNQSNVLRECRVAAVRDAPDLARPRVQQFVRLGKGVIDCESPKTAMGRGAAAIARAGVSSRHLRGDIKII